MQHRVLIDFLNLIILNDALRYFEKTFDGTIKNPRSNQRPSSFIRRRSFYSRHRGSTSSDAHCIKRRQQCGGGERVVRRESSQSPTQLIVVVLHHPLLALAARTTTGETRNGPTHQMRQVAGRRQLIESNRKKKKAKKAVAVFFFGCSLFWHCFPLALGGLLLLYFVSCLKT